MIGVGGFARLLEDEDSWLSIVTKLVNNGSSILILSCVMLDLCVVIFRLCLFVRFFFVQNRRSNKTLCRCYVILMRKRHGKQCSFSEILRAFCTNKNAVVVAYNSRHRTALSNA